MVTPITPAGSSNGLTRLFLKLFGKDSNNSSKYVPTAGKAGPGGGQTGSGIISGGGGGSGVGFHSAGVLDSADTIGSVGELFKSGIKNVLKSDTGQKVSAILKDGMDTLVDGTLNTLGLGGVASGIGAIKDYLIGDVLGSDLNSTDYTGPDTSDSIWGTVDNVNKGEAPYGDVLHVTETPTSGYTIEGIRKAFPELGSLTDSQLEDLLAEYDFEDSFNLSDFSRDYNSMLEGLDDMPTTPILDNYLEDARARVGAENTEMYADLDKLLNERTASYEQQLANLSEDYGTMRSNILSQQYRQNNQLMDTLQSSLDRSRRNALEAGATAGVRIAGDINTLLSVQNKQAATSMETANQLSQMMINQRNAESTLRNSYNDYLSKDTANRHAIKLGTEERASSLANTNYNSAMSSYDAKVKDWDSKHFDNPFYDYRSQMKSKYSSGTTGSSYGND